MKTPTTILKVQQQIAQRKHGFQPKITALIMALFVVAVIALNAGAVDVNLWRWLSVGASSPLQHTILWDIRFSAYCDDHDHRRRLSFMRCRYCKLYVAIRWPTRASLVFRHALLFLRVQPLRY